MKKFVLVAAIAGSLVSGQAIAACTNARLNAASIRALLGNNTVCVPAVTANPMTWQELHVGASGGDLIDYKRGPPPGETVDPSKTVGTWSVSPNGTGTGSNSTVTHNYGSGGTFTYTVHGSGIVGSNHSFCVGATEIVGRVKSGGGPC